MNALQRWVVRWQFRRQSPININHLWDRIDHKAWPDQDRVKPKRVMYPILTLATFGIGILVFLRVAPPDNPTSGGTLGLPSGQIKGNQMATPPTHLHLRIAIYNPDNSLIGGYDGMHLTNGVKLVFAVEAEDALLRHQPLIRIDCGNGDGATYSVVRRFKLHHSGETALDQKGRVLSFAPGGPGTYFCSVQGDGNHDKSGQGISVVGDTLHFQVDE